MHLNNKGISHILLLVLIVVAVTGYGSYKIVFSEAATPVVVHVHDSGKFSRPASLLLKDATAERKVASIITRTELTPDAKYQALAQQASASNWGIKRLDAAGAGEASIEWNMDMWSLVGDPVSVMTTQMRYYSAAGNETPVNMVSKVRLQNKQYPSKVVTVMVVHLAVRNTPQRIAVWNDQMNNLVSIMSGVKAQYPQDKILITGDWNMDWRDPASRNTLVAYANKFGIAVQGRTWDQSRLPKTGGTHGKASVIDMSFSTMQLKSAKLFRDSAASDHRPYLEKLKL